jgi:predicted transposase YbfD/YdcC
VPAVALSRAAARVVEAGPAGAGLSADAWARLEALPDPRSPQGRVYPLACLVAVALCALTAAGHDRLSAVGQWVKRAGQADLARLRAPWDPIAGRYRAPDEKTVRVVLDRLDPRALTAALLGPTPPPPATPTPATPTPATPTPARTVRVWRTRRDRAQVQAAARSRLGAVAVDGKTSRGARRRDGTRVHLLGVTTHAGRFLDQVEVAAKHNETSHFTDLLSPLDLAGQVVTFDALHTVRSNLDWLVTAKNAHYVAVIKANQPLLHARVKALPWAAVPTAATARQTGHGRTETRTLKTAHVTGLDLPHAHQAIKISRWRQDNRTAKITRETIYAATSLTAAQATGTDLARLVREHWTVEAGHHVRDVTFTEDHTTSRTRHGPVNLATIRNAIINTIRDAGYLHIPEGRRDHTTPAEALHLHGLT